MVGVCVREYVVCVCGVFVYKLFGGILFCLIGECVVVIVLNCNLL